MRAVVQVLVMVHNLWADMVAVVTEHIHLLRLLQVLMEQQILAVVQVVDREV